MAKSNQSKLVDDDEDNDEEEKEELGTLNDDDANDFLLTE